MVQGKCEHEANILRRLAPPAHACLPGDNLGLQWITVDGADIAVSHQKVRNLVNRWFASQSQEGTVLTLRGKAHARHWLSRAGSSPYTAVAVGLDRDRIPQAFAVVDVNEPVRSHICADTPMIDPLELPDALYVDIAGWVDPEWRGMGIGRTLLDWQDATARQLAARTLISRCLDLPVRIGDYVDGDASQRRRLLAAGGFSPMRHFAIMTRTLTPSSANTNSAGVQLPELPRGYRWADWAELSVHPIDDKVVRAHNRAFHRHWGSGGQTPERFSLLLEDLASEISPVIMTGEGQVAAYALSTWLPGQLGRIGYTQFLGVDPDHQGHGLSRALLEALAEMMRAAGGSRAGLDVDVSGNSTVREIYASVGYNSDSSEDFYGIEL